MSVKKVLLIYRQNTPEAEKLAKELAAWLKQKNVEGFSCADQSLDSCKTTEDYAKMDLVIVLGGDGTYLSAVKRLGGLNIPILGINMGSLGFLTVTPANNMFSMIEKAIDGSLETRKRTMLEVSVDDEKFTALNDIVLERGAQSYLLQLSIFTDDQHLVSELKADGLIVSSPTGSTAYNLAAGGPILHPHVNAYVLTPICPHSLTNRPVLFPDDQKIHIKVSGQDQKANLTVDGQVKIEITPQSKISIQKSKHEHLVLRKPSHNYYDLLREKLSFGERA